MTKVHIFSEILEEMHIYSAVPQLELLKLLGLHIINTDSYYRDITTRATGMTMVKTKISDKVQIF